jgi:hypothetical protein
MGALTVSRPKLYYYHVTGYEIAKRIIDTGYVDPKLSQGKNNVSWYVTRSRVTWAIAHTCKRHDWQVSDLAILTCKATTDIMLHTNRKGIYATAYKLPILEMVSATMWLDREEMYVSIPRGQRRRPSRPIYPDEF